MNSVLAQIYGTGFEKAASADQELDFNNMSAAELLAGLEDGSIVFDDGAEKVAGDDLDLSEMTGAELLQLIEAADEVESEKTASVMLEKMAHDGTLDYFDMAGRIMAHAYADEFSKVASSGSDEIEVDLNEISGEQLMELIDAGYEFDTDAEKIARSMTGRIGEAVTSRVGMLRRMKGKREAEVAKRVREREFKKMRKFFADRGESGDAVATKAISDKKSLPLQHRAARMRGSQFERNVGRGVVGGVGLSALGLGAGVHQMRKKN